MIFRILGSTIVAASCLAATSVSAQPVDMCAPPTKPPLGEDKRLEAWQVLTAGPSKAGNIQKIAAEYLFHFVNPTVTGSQDRIQFDETDLSKAQLRDVRLPYRSFRNSTLVGTNFISAGLCGCDFTYANMQGAVLNSAVLKGGSLAQADLKMAGLAETDLTDVDLSGTDMSTANNLTQGQLDAACHRNNPPLLPVGLNPPSNICP